MGPFFAVYSGTAFYQIGGMCMAVKKKFRDLTVSDFYRNGKSVPMIRVSGLWLEELGFNVGGCVRIKCDNGQLITSLNEEKPQEKAAEKAFMKEEIKKLEKRFQKVYISIRKSILHSVLVHGFRRYSARFPVISA